MILNFHFKKGKKLPYFSSRKDYHPDLFQIYLEAKSGVIEFCNTHLKYLTIEKLHSYICVDLIK